MSNTGISLEENVTSVGGNGPLPYVSSVIQKMFSGFIFLLFF